MNGTLKILDVTQYFTESNTSLSNAITEGYILTPNRVRIKIIP